MADVVIPSYERPAVYPSFVWKSADVDLEREAAVFLLVIVCWFAVPTTSVIYVLSLTRVGRFIRSAFGLFASMTV
jgi:hypothetical protein